MARWGLGKSTGYDLETNVSKHRLDELFVASKTSTSGQILSESERTAILEKLSSELSRDAG